MRNFFLRGGWLRRLLFAHRFVAQHHGGTKDRGQYEEYQKVSHDVGSGGWDTLCW
jgi:hypothetical protein